MATCFSCRHTGGLFLLLLATLLPGRIESFIDTFECQGDREVPITPKAGDKFAFASSGYPASTNQSCSISINVHEKLSVFIQFIHSYYYGQYNYTVGGGTDPYYCGGLINLDNTEDGAFAQFMIDPQNALKISIGIPENPENEWMGYKAIVFVADPDDTSCPMATPDNAPITVTDDPLIIFPDFYREINTRSYPKNCTWTVKAPPGNVLSFRRMSNELIDNELTVSGSNGGKPFSVFMNGSEVSLIRYNTFDGEVTLHYSRKGISHPKLPAFVYLIDLEPIQVQAKACSLEYNNKLFEAINGTRFTNFVKNTVYGKNEKCAWQIMVPAQTQLRLRSPKPCFEVERHVSGDGFRIEALGETWLEHEFGTDNIIWNDYYVLSGNIPINATIIWETDGLYEYSGFNLTAEFESRASIPDDPVTASTIISTASRTSSITASGSTSTTISDAPTDTSTTSSIASGTSSTTASGNPSTTSIGGAVMPTLLLMATSLLPSALATI